MYCPSSSYAVNVLSIMKMLTNAGTSASKDRTIGFSVKDILDLPTHKSSRANPNSSPITNGTSLALDGNSDNCLTSANSAAYHPAAAALYYSAGICDNPYARWLPPSDMFTYSTPLRKY